jgi:tetratricopeptide (TPR) repeat protein
MTPISARAQARLAQGYAALAAGRWQEAERRGREAVSSRPSDPTALALLAMSLQGLGRAAEAARLYERLGQLQPREPSHWVNLGTVRRTLGCLDEAREAYATAARLGAQGPDFDYNVGLLQIDLGDQESAYRALARAHAARPRDAEIAVYLGSTAVETLRFGEGLAALAEWERFGGLTTELLARIGTVLLNLGDTARAEAALERALADPVLPPEALVQLVLAFERMNRVERAAQLLARLEAVPDGDRVADYALARGRVAQRQGRHEEAAAVYRTLADACAEARDRHFHLFPLARSLDALGSHDAAFEVLEEAHASQTAWIERYQPEVAARRSDTMRVTRFGCDPDDAARWDHTGAPSREASPVFIVAFPRSGTTLLEQVLDAHPRLRSMDEQPYLQEAIARLDRDPARYPAAMAALSREQLDDARAYYWSLVAQRVRLQPGEQLIDKNPLNILRLPAIARLFPHARIVLAIRHPCDVLLSCYMQHFRAEFAWHCRNLPTLALAYCRTIDYWYAQSALLAPAVLEVRYETFVREFEPQVRRLASFLDLPWHDALLEPGIHAERKGFISTPSYAQVLAPVHDRSIERWRPYARHFEPVLGELAPSLQRWGYAAAGGNSR